MTQKVQEEKKLEVEQEYHDKLALELAADGTLIQARRGRRRQAPVRCKWDVYSGGRGRGKGTLEELEQEVDSASDSDQQNRRGKKRKTAKKGRGRGRFGKSRGRGNSAVEDEDQSVRTEKTTFYDE